MCACGHVELVFQSVLHTTYIYIIESERPACKPSYISECVSVSVRCVYLRAKTMKPSISFDIQQ